VRRPPNSHLAEWDALCFASQAPLVVDTRLGLEQKPAQLKQELGSEPVHSKRGPGLARLEMPQSPLAGSIPSAFVLALGDSQDEGVAGSTARAANIARVSARSIDRHACCSRSGDHGGRDRGLQLLTAGGQSA
jgi:hypothetical protein